VSNGRLTPVVVPKPLRKRFAKKTPAMRGSLSACFRQLRIDWRHNSLRAKKMQGRRAHNGADLFEVRASRANRVTFFWDGPRIVIENHCKHDIL
jgi:hypothetical protein